MEHPNSVLHIIIGALAVILITTLSFLPILKNGVVWDDHYYIDEWKTESVRQAFTEPFHLGVRETPYYRPMVTLSIWMDRLTWGTNPAGYHLTNLVLHISASVLFLILLVKNLPVIPSILAAALFAVHPVHVEAVAFIVGRSDILATVFLLVSVITFVFAGEKSVRKRIPWLSASITAFFAAALSKEIAMVMPFLVFFSVVVQSDFKSSRRDSLFLGTIYFLTAGIYALLRWNAFASSNYTPPRMFLSANLNQYPVWILEVVRLLLFPKKLLPYYELSPASPFQAVLSIGLMTLFVFSLVWLGKKRNWDSLFRIGTLLFTLPLVLVLPILPRMGSLIAERFLYLPSLGLLVLIGCLFDLVFQKKQRLGPFIIGAACVFVLAGGYWSHVRSFDWKDDITLYTKALDRDPGNAALHYLLGDELILQERFQEAESSLKQAVSLKPAFSRAQIALSYVYYITGRYEIAREGFLEVLHRDPNNADAHLRLGTLEMNHGSPQRALAELTKAVELDPRSAYGFLHLGRIYANMGALNQAERNWKNALSLNPKNITILINLGILALRKGDEQDAKEYLRRALDIDPDNETASLIIESMESAAPLR